jgi:Na+/melibiose symporter-like transporter
VITGYFIVSIGATTGDYVLPLMLIGIMEVSLAALTVLLVREGPTGRQRDGRSWFAIAREAWDTDILREHSFLYMSATRLLFLMGPSAFINFSLYYVRDTLGQSGADLTFWTRVGLATMAIGTLLGTLPGAKLSERIGRKRVIWGAAVVASVGIVVVAAAGSPTMAVPGLLLIGLGSGAYMAVDWALMTSVIPKVASGRYMGLANIANAISGPMAVVVAGRVLDFVTMGSGPPTGPRAAVACGVLFLAGACLTLTRVHPPAAGQLPALKG